MTEKKMDLFDFVDALPSISEEKALRIQQEKEDKDPWKFAEQADAGNLDIKVEMRHADLRDIHFYNNLPDSQKKQIAPVVLMRWFSNIPDSSPAMADSLVMLNEVLNKNFWNLSKHVGLQWKLMALCGSGRVQNHGWIANPKKRSVISDIDKYMAQWYPHANDLELQILTKKMTRNDFEQFVKSTGADDKELKAQLKTFDSERGTKPEKASKKSK